MEYSSGFIFPINVNVTDFAIVTGVIVCVCVCVYQN